MTESTTNNTIVKETGPVSVSPNKVTFIHIPKNGGSAVTIALRAAKVENHMHVIFCRSA